MIVLCRKGPKVDGSLRVDCLSREDMLNPPPPYSLQGPPCSPLPFCLAELGMLLFLSQLLPVVHEEQRCIFSTHSYVSIFPVLNHWLTPASPVSFCLCFFVLFPNFILHSFYCLGHRAFTKRSGQRIIASLHGTS